MSRNKLTLILSLTLSVLISSAQNSTHPKVRLKITFKSVEEFRKPLKSSKIVEDFVTLFRKEVSFVEQDKVMSVEMDKAIQFVGNYEF